MIRIAVASGKGGTGKTFISVNLWKTLTDQGEVAVLVDCDAEAPDAGIFFEKEKSLSYSVTHKVPEINPDICLFCGKCQEYCNYNAIFILPNIRMIRVTEEMCHGCGACSFICVHGAITEKNVSLGKVTKFMVDGKNILIEARISAGVMSPVPVIKSAIKFGNMNPGIIIYDSPPGTSCPYIHTVAAASYVILVTEPTPFGLSDLKQSIDTLLPFKKPFGVIINRAGLGDNRLKEWLIENNIRLLMEIPFSRKIASLYSEGKVLTSAIPEYKKDFTRLLKTVKNNIIHV